jgi:hypothetical protein
VKFKSLAGLEAAAGRLGGQFLKGQKSYKWYGHWVGDTPMSEGINEKDLGKCDHAISFPGASYTVGVCKTKEGFELRWDYWGSGGLLKHMGDQKGKRFTQAYGVETAKLEARRLGHKVLGERKLKNGKVKLILGVK